MSNDINDKLNKPVPFKQVRYRQQGGGNVMYVPGEHIIQAMNQVFGNTSWESHLRELTCVDVGTNTKGNHVVSYTAQVIVTAGNCRHMDVGFGQGIDRDLGKAHESAVKEAVTDAVKRACRYFGPRAGLYLYFSEGRQEALVAMIDASISLDEAADICKALVPSNPRSQADQELSDAAKKAFTKKKKELENG